MAGEVLLQWSGATDVGRVRSNNQDRYYADPNNGIWVVADGMGGHQGGETASLTACEALAESFTRDDEGRASPETLVDAIQVANRAVHEKGNDDPDLTGMGTTVVALAVVDDGNGDEVFAIANVGDSRAYRFADGVFEQLTEDHSLVAEMVREGSLSPEDAATHPQRNILTRVLGVYDEVPVDVITVIPHPGDRFVLCSDGLFNEVSDEGITSVLRRLVDPAEAADELVRLAVHAGGRDNVTVVVVDVLEDGDRGAAASRALADEPHAGPRHDTAELSAYGSGGAYSDEALDDETSVTSRLRSARHRRKDGEARHAAPRKPRRFTWRVALFSLLVLALIGGVFATIQWYARAAYYVGFDGDEVAIFRGRPGGVAWIEPELEESSGLTRDQLPDDVILTLEEGKEESSLKGAQRYVNTLEDRVAELEEQARDDEPPATTTTTVPPGATATTAPTGPTTTQAPPPA
ncbi:MAG TPA: Stp1/IreP family PP2C-type Ser/Thr phosphatase [Acidimicrobiales bacterium]